MPNSDDEWGFRRSRIFQVQVRVRVRNEQADDRDASNIEQQNTDVNTPDSLGDVTAWVLCFTTSDSYDLGTDERERSLCHHSPPCEEAAFVATNPVILVEGTGMFPVTEPNSVMVRTTAKVKDNPEYDESGYGQYFDRGENEFSLSVCTCSSMSE